MSKSVKHERTTGFLDHLGKVRKIRAAVRALKTSMLNEVDMLLDPPEVHAQDF
jgi:hypothetical protein